MLLFAGTRDANCNVSGVNANVIPPPAEYAGNSSFCPLQKSESVPNASEGALSTSGIKRIIVLAQHNNCYIA